jgi:hypothetical protein
MLATAPYGNNRQDVCNIYVNYPSCPNVGWSYSVDTSTLTNGWHWLRVHVKTADGRETLSDGEFYTNNTTASTVFIDAPSYGTTYSGSQSFSG